MGLPGASPRWNRKRSVPLALPGRGCVVGDAGNDRAEQRRGIGVSPGGSGSALEITLYAAVGLVRLLIHGATLES